MGKALFALALLCCGAALALAAPEEAGPEGGTEAGGAHYKQSNTTKLKRVVIDETKPLSTAMKCCITLLITYFIVQTLILISREGMMSKVTGMGKKNDDIDIEGAEEGLLSGSASNAGSAAAGCCASLLDEKKLAKTTDTLAFVPMLCIIMVFARLRANDMGLDPQMWGQMAMWCATIAILVQTIIVLAFPSLESGDGSDDDEGAPLSANAQNRVEEDDSANSSFIALLGKIIRFTAVASLYAGVIVLIVSIITLRKEKEIFV